jgi:hypothetical protein
MLSAAACGGRSNGQTKRKTKRTPKNVVKLLDLEQSKSAVLTSAAPVTFR